MTTTQTKIPTIQEVFKLITTQKEEYGFYWVANRLEKINAPLNYGSELEGFVYSAWINNKDANFIIPKLYSDWAKGGGYYEKQIMRKYGIFVVAYKRGNNGNVCVSLTFTPLSYL